MACIDCPDLSSNSIYSSYKLGVSADHAATLVNASLKLDTWVPSFLNLNCLVSLKIILSTYLIETLTAPLAAPSIVFLTTASS